LWRAKLLNLARAIEREVDGSKGGGYPSRSSLGSFSGFGAREIEGMGIRAGFMWVLERIISTRKD